MTIRGCATALRPAQARQGRLRRPRRNGAASMRALDLGTNNCRLLIASPAGDRFRVVDSFSRIIRLGEGISATGSISEAAIDRAIAALEHLQRQDPLPQGAGALRLIATEACRAAANADSFRDRVAAETGIRLEVIDRETEATLAVIGCSPLLDPQRAGRHPVRHRRRLDRAGPDRARSGRAECAAADQGVDVDPARRRHVGRAFRRHVTSPRNPTRRWCARSRAVCRAVRRRARRGSCATCTCWAPPAP